MCCHIKIIQSTSAGCGIQVENNSVPLKSRWFICNEKDIKYAKKKKKSKVKNYLTN